MEESVSSAKSMLLQIDAKVKLKIGEPLKEESIIKKPLYKNKV